MVDTSDIGCHPALLQEGRYGVDHPVCYFPYQFNCHQKYYLTCKKETLALLLALQHFRVYLDAPVDDIVVYTDHNPLVFVNRMRDKNQRLMRWSLALQEYVRVALGYVLSGVRITSLLTDCLDQF